MGILDIAAQGGVVSCVSCFCSPCLRLTDTSSLNKLFKMILIIKILNAEWETFWDSFNFSLFKSIIETKNRYSEEDIKIVEYNTCVLKFFAIKYEINIDITNNIIFVNFPSNFLFFIQSNFGPNAIINTKRIKKRIINLLK